MGTPEMGGVLALPQLFAFRLDAGHDGDHADQNAGIVAAEALLLMKVGAVGIGLRRGEDEVAELHGHDVAAALVGGTDPAANRLLDGADAVLLLNIGAGLVKPGRTGAARRQSCRRLRRLRRSGRRGGAAAGHRREAQARQQAACARA